MRSTALNVVLIAILVTLAVMFFLGRSILYTVNERELAVVLQFGEPVAQRTEPGLYFKMPFIQEVRRLPKTYQFWNADSREVVVDLPTADGKKIEVTPWAIWRITDPTRFVQVLRTTENAETRVHQFVRSEVRNVVTRNSLVQVVRNSDRPLTYTLQVEPAEKTEAGAPTEQQPSRPGQGPAAPAPDTDEKVTVGREEIVRQIKAAVQQELAEAAKGQEGGRGIELVDVGISRIDFVPTVREAAFDRLIAFMQSIASLYVHEGERRKQEILNKTEAEVQKILGEGRQEANRTRGQVDAEIITKYAAAIQETGEFYNFIRTLEAYQQALGANSRLILTTDSALFGLLKTLPGAAESSDAKD